MDAAMLRRPASELEGGNGEEVAIVKMKREEDTTRDKTQRPCTLESTRRSD